MPLELSPGELETIRGCSYNAYDGSKLKVYPNIRLKFCKWIAIPIPIECLIDVRGPANQTGIVPGLHHYINISSKLMRGARLQWSKDALYIVAEDERIEAPNWLVVIKQERPEVNAIAALEIEYDIATEEKIQIVVLYSEKELRFGGNPQNEDPTVMNFTSDVTSKSKAFLVWQPNSGSERELQKIELKRPRLISYACAHLGEAKMKMAFSEHSIGPILLSSCRTFLVNVINDWFHPALLLRPDYRWARAHLAEAFRTMGNAFPNTFPDLADGNQSFRITDYARALFYFKDSISDSAEKRYSWAHAHLGATIINARSFSDWPSANCRKPACIGALERFLEIDNEPGESLSIYRFAEKANEHFVQALDSKPIYPWASVYHSGGILLKAMLIRRHSDYTIEDSDNLNVLGRVVLEQSLYVDPEVLREMFDPQQAWVNALFETAIVCVAQERYDDAWEHVITGLRHPSKDPVTDGVQELWGCYALVLIALLGQSKTPGNRKSVLEEIGYEINDDGKLWEGKRPTWDICGQKTFFRNRLIDGISAIRRRPAIQRLMKLGRSKRSTSRVAMGISLWWEADVFFTYAENVLKAKEDETSEDITLSHTFRWPWWNCRVSIELKKECKGDFVRLVRTGRCSDRFKLIGRGVPCPFSPDQLTMTITRSES